MEVARIRLAEPGFEEEEADIPSIDIKDVSRCLCVYEALGERSTFKAEYLETRKTGILKTLSIKHAELGGGRRDVDWDKYYTRICGFFAVEDAIFRAYSEEFTTSTEVKEELWGLARVNLLRKLKDVIPKLTTEKHLALKSVTEVFCVAMKELGFSCDPIIEYFESTTTGEQGSGIMKMKLLNELRAKVTP